MSEQKLKTPEILCGEYYFTGNLREYVQRAEIKVKLPIVDLNGERLNGKLVVEHCLVSKHDKGERDHASLRLQSVQEVLSLYTSIVLATREYTKTTMAKPDYVFQVMEKRLREVFQGEFDYLLRKR